MSNFLNKKNKFILKRIFKTYSLVILGSCIMAVGIAFFLLPNQLSSGGFSGIATIAYYLFNIPMGRTILILNIPTFIFAYFRLGKDSFFKSLVGTFSLSLFIDLFDKVPEFTHDRVLGCIFGGLLVGIGTSLVLRGKGSTGGSDLVANVIRSYKPYFKTGTLIIIIDIIIVSLNVVAFKQLEIGLYSAITIYLLGKMIDIVFEGTNFTKQLYIISDKYEAIVAKINTEIKRGTTGLYGKGMYKNDDKIILLCVASRNEAIKIIELTRKIDKSAFIIISNAREVIGRGFKGSYPVKFHEKNK